MRPFPLAKSLSASTNISPVQTPEPLRLRKARTSTSSDTLHFPSVPSRQIKEQPDSDRGYNTKNSSKKKSSSSLTQQLRKKLSWSKASTLTSDLDEVCNSLKQRQHWSTNVSFQDKKPKRSQASEAADRDKRSRLGILSRMMGSFENLVCLSGMRSPEKKNSRVFKWKEGGKHRRSAKSLRISAPLGGRRPIDPDIWNNGCCSVSPGPHSPQTDPFSTPSDQCTWDSPNTMRLPRSPMSVPITYADVFVEPDKIELQYDGTARINVDVKANVSNLDKNDTPNHTPPLDVLILVDNSYVC